MKWTRIITHPYLLIASFCLILFSGKHFGGFYLLYLLIALPSGSIHSLAAFIGFLVLIIAHKKFERQSLNAFKPIVNLLGLTLLYASLYTFFILDPEGYNDDTFIQLLPQITIAIFVFLSLAFLIHNLLPYFRRCINQAKRI